MKHTLNFPSLLPIAFFFLLTLGICPSVMGEPLPKYEWKIESEAQNEGAFILNSGTAGEDVSPAKQFLAAPGLILDETGNPRLEREVWPENVEDPLGHHEAIVLQFDDLQQRHGLFLRSMMPDDRPERLKVSLWVKQIDGDQGSFILGSASDGIGPTTIFAPTDAWTRVVVEFETDAGNYDIVIRPSSDTKLPARVALYAPMLQKSDEVEIPLHQFREARRAGHAHSPLALRGGILPDGQWGNFQAEIDPHEVGQFAISGWIKVDELPPARAFFAGLSRTKNPSENAQMAGRLGIYGASNEKDFRGRLHYSPGRNLDKQLYSPHTDGSGWLHVHINFGHSGSDLEVPPDRVAHELLVNGIPFHERLTDPSPSVVARLFSLGGIDGSAKSIQSGAGAWHNAFELVRFEPGVRITRDEVLARVKKDREAHPKLQEPFDSLIIVEGDSTSQQRGSPIFMVSRELRQPGRLFVNHARGGSWYQGGIESNSDYIGTGQRRAMRQEAMEKGLDLGYRKVFTLWTPGENDLNGRAVLRPGADAKEAVKILTDFILDDLEAVDPERKKTRSIFVSMKMSDFREEAKTQVRAYWEALDAIYTEPVDPENAPFLFRAPEGTPGRTHDYFIAMHKWKPTDGEHTWESWEALAADAKAGRNGARNIVSGDGQHWTQGWNPHVAEAVHIPSLRKIFEIEEVD